MLVISLIAMDFSCTTPALHGHCFTREYPLNAVVLHKLYARLMYTKKKLAYANILSL